MLRSRTPGTARGGGVTSRRTDALPTGLASLARGRLQRLRRGLGQHLALHPVQEVEDETREVLDDPTPAAVASGRGTAAPVAPCPSRDPWSDGGDGVGGPSPAVPALRIPRGRPGPPDQQAREERLGQ